MCLAVPGRIAAITEEDPLTRAGTIDFSGNLRTVNLALVPEAMVGDHVIVHAGFAIARLDEAEARRTLDYIDEAEAEAEAEDAAAAAPESDRPHAHMERAQ